MFGRTSSYRPSSWNTFENGFVSPKTSKWSKYKSFLTFHRSSLNFQWIDCMILRLVHSSVGFGSRWDRDIANASKWALPLNSACPSYPFPLHAMSCSENIKGTLLSKKKLYVFSSRTMQSLVTLICNLFSIIVPMHMYHTLSIYKLWINTSQSAMNMSNESIRNRN